ncbi:MAG: hypothetical protein WBA67_15590 [Jannaschia sp.]
MIRGIVLLPLLVIACAPVPMSAERAQELCSRELRQADGVSGSIGVGIGSGGARARGGITVTNRVLNPQTPEDFLADCIARRVAGKPAPATFGLTVGGRT